ncbi:MAG TPA: alpha/beta fold hydrolase [Phototrophicaceae bacterium]|nr:alpha/beta fold hydrolase [Phototrophicaceae bacterium]
MTSGYVRINGGNIYYEMAGQGETLVLSHAGFVDSGMWDDQWTELTRHYRVIRYDLRGFGKSDPAAGPVSRRDDLLQLLNHLAVERAYLLGCSLSGELILDFALEHQERVAALIPVSATPSGFAMQGEPPPLLLEMFGAMQQGDWECTSDLQIRLWVDGMFRQPGQVNAVVRQRAAAMNRIPVENQTFAIADSQPVQPLNPPAVERLSEINVPTLVIAGALDHPEILRAADVMAAEIRGARKLVLPNCAHVPNMEKPQEFNRAVLEFLQGL